MLLAAPLGATPGGDRATDPSWPSSGFDAGNTSYNAAETAITSETVKTLEPVWLRDDQYWEHHAVAGHGRFYATCHAGVCAHHPDDGRTLWELPGESGAAPVVIDDDVVFATWSPWGLRRVRGEDGENVWTSSRNAEARIRWVRPGPLGLVFAGSEDEHLYAFDAATGEFRWRAHIDPQPHYWDPLWAPAAFYGDTVFVTSGRKLYALDAETGAFRHRYHVVPGIDTNAPVVSGDRVLVPSGRQGHVTAYPATGCGDLSQVCQPLYATHLGLRTVGLAVRGDVAYVGSQPSDRDEPVEMVALDVATGEVLWRSEGAEPRSTPVIAGDLVWVGSDGVYAAFPADGCGAEVCRFVDLVRVGDPLDRMTRPPIVAYGTLLVPEGYAFRPAAAARATTPPSAPRDVQTAPNPYTSGTTDLTWDAPTETGTFPILYYVVVRSDGLTWENWRPSNQRVRVHADGPETAYTYEVRAATVAGWGPATPADTEIPSEPYGDPPRGYVTFVSGPPATTTSTTATLEFSAAPGFSYLCSLDLETFRPCENPTTVDGVEPGRHQFRVRTADGGNRSPWSTLTWEVEGSTDSTTTTTSTTTTSTTSTSTTTTSTTTTTTSTTTPPAGGGGGGGGGGGSVGGGGGAPTGGTGGSDPGNEPTAPAPPEPPAGPVSPEPPTVSPGLPAIAERGGYWLLERSGAVHGFGDAEGATSATAGPATDIAAAPTGDGYWVLHGDGSVEPIGGAPRLGGAPALASGESPTTVEPTPTGRGYWIFTSQGRVFAFGDAEHLGDLRGRRLNGAIVDGAATPSGRGYYLVAGDGGVFTFGDAEFRGSMGGARLNRPIVGMAADPDGDGYWLVASDGGIFSFGARFHGSAGALPLNRPITSMLAGSDGYLLVADDGGVFTYGVVRFHGSLGDHPPASPVVAAAVVP